MWLVALVVHHPASLQQSGSTQAPRHAPTGAALHVSLAPLVSLLTSLPLIIASDQQVGLWAVQTRQTGRSSTVTLLGSFWWPWQLQRRGASLAARHPGGALGRCGAFSAGNRLAWSLRLRHRPPRSGVCGCANSVRAITATHCRVTK